MSNATSTAAAGGAGEPTGGAAKGGGGEHAQAEGSVKETLITLLISFLMALVFRSYIVEAFVIPTGSMAPTLLGQHMQFRSAQTGYVWTVNPWYMANLRGGGQVPENPQGTGVPAKPFPYVADPMTSSDTARHYRTLGGQQLEVRDGWMPPPEEKSVRSGDRILVMKALYPLGGLIPAFAPERFDVVVFKNPEDTKVNYIKRLLGLPNEEVWLVDGDVFSRPIEVAPRSEQRADECVYSVKGEFAVQRKPDHIQRALWRPIFSSEHTPLNPMDAAGRAWFTPPWSGAGWSTDRREGYRCEESTMTALNWDSQTWPITDFVPYNDIPRVQKLEFPVGDVRLRAGVKPDRDGLALSATVMARRHEFQARIEGDRAVLRMRPMPDATNAAPAWTELASASVKPMRAGRAVDLEFWHADQALSLWIDGKKVVSAGYEWSPWERVAHSTTASRENVENTPGSVQGNPLTEPPSYEPARAGARWEFEGSPLTMTRVGLDCDVYYQPAGNRGGTLYRSGLGATPNTTARMNSEQYFCCGDNSAASHDGRMWTSVDAEVKRQVYDGTVYEWEQGVVHKHLMLGKAFFVYFPSPYRVGVVPIPDFGEMRFIR